MLIGSGFNLDSVHIRITERQKGIARDLMDEAQKGYEALLIRRRGSARSLLPLALGSVSTKLVKKTTSLPILVAGVQKMNHSLLIAVDGSEGSKRAVEFVAQTVEHSDCRIVLCSILRDFQVYDEYRKEKLTACVRAAFEKIELVIKPSVARLETAGVQKKNISIRLIQHAKSRAMAIVETARQENCHTIVLGRRGKSNVSEFDMGRIPWKVIHGATEMTVWLVP